MIWTILPFVASGLISWAYWVYLSRRQDRRLARHKDEAQARAVREAIPGSKANIIVDTEIVK